MNDNSKKISQQAVKTKTAKRGIRNKKAQRGIRDKFAQSGVKEKFAQEAVFDKHVKEKETKERQGQSATDPYVVMGQVMSLLTGVNPEALTKGLKKAREIGELRIKYKVKDDIPDFEISEEVLKDPKKRKALESKYYEVLRGVQVSKKEIEKLVNASYLTDKIVSADDIKNLSYKEYKDLYNLVDKKISKLAGGQFNIDKIDQHPVSEQIRQFRNRDPQSEVIYPTSYQIYNEEKKPVILNADQIQSLQERFVKSSGHNYVEYRDKEGNIHWYNTLPEGSVIKHSPDGFDYLDIPKGTVVDELTLREKSKRDAEYLLSHPPAGINPALIIAAQTEPFKSVAQKDLYNILLGVNQIKKGYYESDILKKYLHINFGLSKIVRSVPNAILNFPVDFTESIIKSTNILPKESVDIAREIVDIGSPLYDVGEYLYKGVKLNPFTITLEAANLADEYLFMKLMDMRGAEIKYYDESEYDKYNPVKDMMDPKTREKLKYFSKENQEKLKGNQNYNHHILPKKIKIQSSVINSSGGLSSDNISAYNAGSVSSYNTPTQFSSGNNFNESNSSGDTYGMSSVTPFGNIFFQVVASNGISVDIDSTHPRVLRNGYS